MKDNGILPNCWTIGRKKMPEIRLVKKYPHIKDEDVTSIFQEGYIKGFENGRKGAIPVEWIKEWRKEKWLDSRLPMEERMVRAMVARMIVEDWEKENGTNRQR